VVQAVGRDVRADGRGRNYYTEFAEAVPKDCVILTLACGKYRFNKLEFGDIGGIPRLLDVGQCNDAYSAVVIAQALAEAFDTDVNGLPLSIICSWYEQKAVCVLLSLLSLGVRNIRLGPSLPAFVTPAALKILVEKFAIKPVGAVADDLKACLARGQEELPGCAGLDVRRRTCLRRHADVLQSDHEQHSDSARKNRFENKTGV
jgi:hydroxylamine reductase